MLTAVTRDVLLDFARRMLLIRHFEEKLIYLHSQGHFRGHYHVYVGQEATGVGTISCLEPNDHIFTTHRNHGHLLARGADPKKLFAEILGRDQGYNQGKGGTFHVAIGSLGFPHTSAIVGGMIPLATGAAYGAKLRGRNQISVCFFGDGALEEGVAAESFNLASLWKLPVLYICENNGKYGRDKNPGVSPSSTLAAYPLTKIPAAYAIPTIQVDGSKISRVYAAVSEAVQKIRSGDGPQFVESQTVRWPGSEARWPKVPVNSDVDLAWDESSIPLNVRQWYRDSDPLLLFIRELVAEEIAARDELAELNAQIKIAVSEAADFAINSPFGEPNAALTDILR